MTTFAKWSDYKWYNAEILAMTEASYTVTYIDYGNSEDVVERDVVGDVGRYQFVKIEEGAPCCNYSVHLVLKK